MTAAGKPKQETGALAIANELDAVSPPPICSETDRPEREPETDWRQLIGSHANVKHPLDTQRHQRSSGAAKPPGRQADLSPVRLILMGVWRDSSQP